MIVLEDESTVTHDQNDDDAWSGKGEAAAAAADDSAGDASVPPPANQAGFHVPADTSPEEQHTSTYADAVKATESSIDIPATNKAATAAEASITGSTESEQPDHLSGASQRASSEQPIRIVPERRVSFPPLSEPMSQTHSTQSDHSASAHSHQSQQSDHHASGASPCTLEALGPHSGGAAGIDVKDKGEGKRNRLSSIKGFVRRISDQGVNKSSGVSRSVSGGSKNAMGEVEEEVAAEGDAKEGKDKRRKRLSMRG